MLTFAFARVRRGASGIETIALILLYVGGFIVSPVIHKAAVCCECSHEMSQATRPTRNGPTEIVAEPSDVHQCNHNPLTCSICQLASVTQIVGHSHVPPASQHVVVADVRATSCLYEGLLGIDAHRARGPPLIS